jgi:uncharacterized alpha-E superfamily protein
MRIASCVKERLSLEVWNAASSLNREVANLPPAHGPVISDRTLRALDAIIGLLSSISGLFMENMTRGDSWLFQDLGRRVERGLHLSNLIYSTLTPPSRDPEGVLRLLLLCADSLITYRRRYLTVLHPVSVIDLLVFDPHNPRSLAFQVAQIGDHLAELPHRRDAGPPLPMDKTALRLGSQLGLGDPHLLDERTRGRRAALARFLDALADHLGEFSDQVAHHYFALTRRRASAGLPRPSLAQL